MTQTLNNYPNSCQLIFRLRTDYLINFSSFSRSSNMFSGFSRRHVIQGNPSSETHPHNLIHELLASVAQLMICLVMFCAPKFFRASADLFHGKCITFVCICVRGMSGEWILLNMYGESMCIYSQPLCVCLYAVRQQSSGASM